VALGQTSDDLGAQIVPRPLVLGARVPQADSEQVGSRTGPVPEQR